MALCHECDQLIFINDETAYVEGTYQDELVHERCAGERRTSQVVSTGEDDV